MSSGDKTISPSGAFNQIFLNSQMSLHDIEDIILHVCIMSPNLMTIVSCVSIYNIALKLFNVENNVYTITIPMSKSLYVYMGADKLSFTIAL